MADSTSDDLLRFGCKHCGVHLAISISLAGIEGPCPRCGETLQAPKLAEQPRIPTSVVTREVGGQPLTTRDEAPESGRTKFDAPRYGSAEPSGRRRVSSSKRSSTAAKEKEEMKTALKVSLAAVVGILVFVAISWYLKNYWLMS